MTTTPGYCTPVQPTATDLAAEVHKWRNTAQILRFALEDTTDVLAECGEVGDACPSCHSSIVDDGDAVVHDLGCRLADTVSEGRKTLDGAAVLARLARADDDRHESRARELAVSWQTKAEEIRAAHEDNDVTDDDGHYAIWRCLLACAEELEGVLASAHGSRIPGGLTERVDAFLARRENALRRPDLVISGGGL